MKTLITPSEVVDLAFEGNHGMDREAVGTAVILSAQQKFIKPALGGLYPCLEAGKYGELLDEYLKPALAYYVKLLLLPTLAASVGSLGIVQHKSDNFAAADAKRLSALRCRTRSEASTLMMRAIDFIEANIDDYPEYNPGENVLHRTSIVSQIVL